MNKNPTSDEYVMKWSESVTHRKATMDQLHIDLKKYKSQAREFHAARKRIITTLLQLYDEDWPGRTGYAASVKEFVDTLPDYFTEFDNITNNMDIYLNELKSAKTILSDFKTFAKQAWDASKGAMSQKPKKVDQAHAKISDFLKVSNAAYEVLPELANKRAGLVSIIVQNFFENERRLCDKNTLLNQCCVQSAVDLKNREASLRKEAPTMPQYGLAIPNSDKSNDLYGNRSASNANIASSSRTSDHVVDVVDELHVDPTYDCIDHNIYMESSAPAAAPSSAAAAPAAARRRPSAISAAVAAGGGLKPLAAGGAYNGGKPSQQPTVADCSRFDGSSSGGASSDDKLNAGSSPSSDQRSGIGNPLVSAPMKGRPTVSKPQPSSLGKTTKFSYENGPPTRPPPASHYDHPAINSNTVVAAAGGAEAKSNPPRPTTPDDLYCVVGGEPTVAPPKPPSAHTPPGAAAAAISNRQPPLPNNVFVVADKTNATPRKPQRTDGTG